MADNPISVFCRLHFARVIVAQLFIHMQHNIFIAYTFWGSFSKYQAFLDSAVVSAGSFAHSGKISIYVHAYMPCL